MICGVVDFYYPHHADSFQQLLVDDCADIFRCARISPTGIRFRARYWDGDTPTKAVRLHLDVRAKINTHLRGHAHTKTLVTTVAHVDIDLAGLSMNHHFVHKLPAVSTWEWEPDREEYGDRHNAIIDLHKYDALDVRVNYLVRFDLDKQDIDRVLSCGMRYLPTWLFGPRIDKITAVATRANPPRSRFLAKVPSLKVLTARAVRRIPEWDHRLPPIPRLVQRLLDDY